MLSEVGAVSVVQVGSKSREIENPLTWAFYFLALLAVSVKNQKAKDMAAYAQLIIHLSQKHGERVGWPMRGCSGNRPPLVPTTHGISWPPSSWLLPLWSQALPEGHVKYAMAQITPLCNAIFQFLRYEKKEKEREEKDMLKTSKERGALHQGQ